MFLDQWKVWACNAADVLFSLSFMLLIMRDPGTTTPVASSK